MTILIWISILDKELTIWVREQSILYLGGSPNSQLLC